MIRFKVFKGAEFVNQTEVTTKEEGEAWVDALIAKIGAGDPPGTYHFVEEDMTTELADKARVKEVRDKRKSRILHLAEKAKGKALTTAEREEAIEEMLRSLAPELD